MSSSRDTQDEVVPDTLLTPHAHVNGSGEQKTLPRTLCATTVKEDTTHVMRCYLLKTSSLTEKDIGIDDDDLQVDAESDSQDDPEQVSQKELINNIADRLARIGDEKQKEYEEKAEADAISNELESLLQTHAYEAFSDVLRRLSSRVCGTDNNTNSLAFVFNLTRRCVEGVRAAGNQVALSVEYAERYIWETYGPWIAERGGWGHILDQVDGTGSAV